MISFSLSCRTKPIAVPLEFFIRTTHANHTDLLNRGKIDSAFGFVEHSSLYGGRVFIGAEISPKDLTYLYDNGIGLKLPVSNDTVSEESYQQNKKFLRKYYRKNNSLVISCDKLATWVRNDFPDYQIEASVIKNIRTIEQLKALSGLYDTIVLPMYLNDDIAFLKSIVDKKNIRLFANAGCAYKCPSKICYSAIAEQNRTSKPSSQLNCVKHLNPKKYGKFGKIQAVSLHFFDLDMLIGLGFEKYKLLTSVRGRAF